MKKLDKDTANKMVTLLEKMNTMLLDITQEEDDRAKTLMWIKYSKLDNLYNDVLSTLGSLDTFCESQ